VRQAVDVVNIISNNDLCYSGSVLKTFIFYLSLADFLSNNIQSADMGQHRWPGEVLANFRFYNLSLVTLLSAIGLATIFNFCGIASGQGTEFNLVETEDGFYVSVNGLKLSIY
jgi:hypothetical protein